MAVGITVTKFSLVYSRYSAIGQCIMGYHKTLLRILGGTAVNCGIHSPNT